MSSSVGSSNGLSRLWCCVWLGGLPGHSSIKHTDCRGQTWGVSGSDHMQLRQAVMGTRHECRGVLLVF